MKLLSILLLLFALILSLLTTNCDDSSSSFLDLDRDTFHVYQVIDQHIGQYKDTLYQKAQEGGSWLLYGAFMESTYVEFNNTGIYDLKQNRYFLKDGSMLSSWFYNDVIYSIVDDKAIYEHFLCLLIYNSFTYYYYSNGLIFSVDTPFRTYRLIL